MYNFEPTSMSPANSSSRSLQNHPSSLSFSKVINIKISMSTLFSEEWILCDYIFSAFDGIKESCFTAICKDGALGLFQFTNLLHLIATSLQKKDVGSLTCTTLSPNSAERFESTISAIRSQAIASLVKLDEAILTTIFLFLFSLFLLSIVAFPLFHSNFAVLNSIQ